MCPAYSEKLGEGVRYKGHEALVGREEAMNIKGPNPIPHPTLRTEDAVRSMSAEAWGTHRP